MFDSFLAGLGWAGLLLRTIKRERNRGEVLWLGVFCLFLGNGGHQLKVSSSYF